MNLQVMVWIATHKEFMQEYLQLYENQFLSDRANWVNMAAKIRAEFREMGVSIKSIHGMDSISRNFKLWLEEYHNEPATDDVADEA